MSVLSVQAVAKRFGEREGFFLLLLQELRCLPRGIKVDLNPLAAQLNQRDVLRGEALELARGKPKVAHGNLPVKLKQGIKPKVS